jgi:hypothetical protein
VSSDVRRREKSIKSEFQVSHWVNRVSKLDRDLFLLLSSDVRRHKNPSNPSFRFHIESTGFQNSTLYYEFRCMYRVSGFTLSQPSFKTQLHYEFRCMYRVRVFRLGQPSFKTRLYYEFRCMCISSFRFGAIEFSDWVK